MDAERDGARAREEIVEEIVENLRPWSLPEKAVHEGVVNSLDHLLEVDVKARINEHSTREGKKAARDLKLKRAVSALIDFVEGIPADHLLFEMPGFSSRAGFLRDLQLLRDMCAVLERSKNVSKHVDLTKKFCAFFACGLISAFSKRPPTTTVEGPMWSIASLMYEAVTKEPDVNMKRACDKSVEIFKIARARNEKISHHE